MKIGKNIFWNFAGFLCPAIVLFVSYPVLLRALGNEQFGLVALATSLSAALSFLDFGLSSASLKFIVGDLERGDRVAAGKVITTSLAFFGAMGLLISAVMFLLSPWLAGWLRVSVGQRDVAVEVFRITALQISFSLVLSTVSGIFKALDRFDLSAGVITAVALAANAMPAWMVAVRGQTLVDALIVAVLLLAILCVTTLALMDSIAQAKGVEIRHAPPDRKTFRRTVGFGAYLTVHGLVGMLFSHGQRVMVGFLFGPAPLAAFQLSLTIVSKVHTAINAVAEVALPIASGSQRHRIRGLYFKALTMLIVLSALPLLVLSIASNTVLTLWLGSSVPPFTADILPPLCLAYFFVAIAALPFHIINGLGLPQINVLLGVVNLVVYVLALIGFELAHERSAVHVAMAYAVSNVICGIAYQWYCLTLLRRR